MNLKILMDEKSWKTWKSNQNGVMDEELVRNGVMDAIIAENVTSFAVKFSARVFDRCQVNSRLVTILTNLVFSDFLL